MSNLETAKQEFLAAGGKLTYKNVQSVLRDAENRARKEAEYRSSPPNKWATKRIKQGLGVLSVTFFIVILTIGVLALLIAVPAAEFVAVFTGLQTITSNNVIVGLTTFALFIGMIVPMFLRHVYEDALPEGKPSYRDKNLPKVARDYLMIKTVLNIAKIVILCSSLLGRLGETYAVYREQPLGSALTDMAANLTAQEFIGAVVSVMIVFALITMLDVGVLFVYTAFKNSAGRLDIAEVTTEDFLPAFERLSDDYQAEALRDLTMQLQAIQNREHENSE